MMHLLYLLFILPQAFGGYDVTCPSRPHWNFRAKAFCGNIEDYRCLWDANYHRFIEQCEGYYEQRKGLRKVILGDITAGDCTANTYQPRKWITTGNFDCEFLKSPCTDIGQFIFKDGGGITDRTCGCDFTAGYVFLKKPKNLCYCEPTLEDCTCVKKTCYPHQKVDPEYQCRSIFKWKSWFDCPAIPQGLTGDIIPACRDVIIGSTTEAPIVKSQTITEVRPKFISNKNNACVVVAIGIVLFIITGIGGIGVLVINREMEMKTERNQEIADLQKQISEYSNLSKTALSIKREIRVIVVGKTGVGKTCLVRRLRSKTISDIKATDGIEIHSFTCKDDTRDDISWQEKTQTLGSEVVNKRLRQSDNKPGSFEQSEAKQTERAEEESEDNSKPLQQSGFKTTNVTPRATLNQSNGGSIRVASSEIRTTKINDMTSAKTNDEGDIRIYVWDFGGDEEFCYTHQLFLAEDAVYVIVTSVDPEDDLFGDKFDVQFWFDTIHCLCKDEKKDKLNPRCIVVGTKIDKVRIAAESLLKKKIQSVPLTLQKHIYGGFLISNKESCNKTTSEIKRAIINAAKESTQWETKHPLKFILLDNALDVKRRHPEERPVITLSDIRCINDNLLQPLTEHEIELYLRYNHITGHLIYYKDIPDCIVIDPQWLSDLFRCIVTADKFRSSQLPYSDLDELRLTGKLTDTLLKDIFDIKGVVGQLQPYLLKLMERFHIVIQLASPSEETEKMYFAPCMVRNESFDATKERCKEKSTWLCLHSDFIPPFFFNHIIVSFSDKYRHIGLPKFYSNGAVLDISPCEKLVILRLRNVIQLQVMMLDHQNSPSRKYSEIKNLLTKQMTDLTQTFSMTIYYKYKWKCPESSKNCRGHLNLDHCREGEKYKCVTCSEEGRKDSLHIFHNYWDDHILQKRKSIQN